MRRRAIRDAWSPTSSCAPTREGQPDRPDHHQHRGLRVPRDGKTLEALVAAADRALYALRRRAATG